MKKTPNKRLIGFFTLIGILMFVAVIFYYLGGSIFRQREHAIVMYFEESIKGLNVGSSVMFRGIEIGKVDKIDLVISPDEVSFSTIVFASLDNEQSLKFKKDEGRNIKNLIRIMIKKGLRAKLVTQSYLTGQLMIELEIVPNPKPFVPHIEKNNRSIASNIMGKNNPIEIPTILSPMEELSKGFQDMPIREIIEKIDNLLFVFNNTMPIILEQTSKIATNINSITSDINYVISNNYGNIPATITNLNRTIADIGDAARALRNFADYIERHPETLLKGKREY